MMKFKRLRMAARIKNRRSSALIITLFFLVIISAVLLALVSSTRNDLVNSRVFAGGQATTLLADTAVNLVEGQITAASTQPLVSWASQPGMIHAYDTGTGNTAYKLYSSDTMVTTNWSATTQTAETTAMTGWKTATDPSSYNAMWCDLNAPAVVNRLSPTNTSVTVATPVFPIVDPGAIGIVQGFGASTAVPGTTLTTDSTRRLPMPVKWMYILKNGQLVAPSSMTGSVGSATVATFSGTSAPSSTNQIIGRIAFWADDDTCKLNINTACEGTYWDTPRADVQSEWYLAASVPILDEFQAIGGHPATTCMDPVLGDLLPRPTLTDTSINTSSGAISFSGNYSQLQAYYALNPRISDNAQVIFPLTPSTTMTNSTTSQGGTVNTISTRNSTLFVRSVVFKGDRLYATPDELLFRPDRTFNTNASGNPLTPAMLAQRDFFLTAQSRAPETTLFGTPRICLWPVQQIINTSQICRSARDNLIDFCANVGGTNYDFQRGQVSVYNYNGTYQTSPNPASTSVTNDWNIARNQSLFNYATNMMATTEPGFGSSLASKWGSHGGTEREMTLAMDTIRSTLNQNGITSPTSTTSPPAWWAYRNEIPLPGNVYIRGSVIPLQVTTPNGTFNGIGRDWRIASAAIQIIPTARNPKTVGPPAVDGWVANDPQPSTTQIQAILLLNFYNPMPTVQIVEPSFRITVTNPTGGLGISIPGDLNKHDIGSGTVLLQYTIGGSEEFLRNYAFPGFAGLLYPANSSGSGSLRTFTQGPTVNDLTNNYPWVTAPVTTNTNSPTFTINPGTIAVQIQEGGATTNTVQTENLYFPGWTNGPLPQSVTISANSGAQTGGDPALLPFSSRSPQATSGNNMWFQNGDIVREVQLDPNGPAKGDYRLLATETNIPSNYFAPNVNYTNSFNAFVTTNAATTAAVQAEVGSMTNRFAFAFPNENNGSTWGVGNGYDSALGNGGPNGTAGRLGGVAVTGVTWLGLLNGVNSWRYGQEYTNNIGGLVNNLYYSMNNSQSTPVIAPSAQALSSSPSTTLPTTGWAPSNASGGLGDWSTSYSWVSDGAIFSAPDTATWTSVGGATEPTYFSGPADWTYSLDEAVNEPNRVVPSPIIFGSQPTPKANSDRNGGVSDDLQPWQSMLLCPNPLAGSSHPGFGQGGTGTGPTALPPFSTSVPDHLFIDLFWMPVVEPYALSDPLSTAGKVNLNYEMEPFTHITRRTALVGVLTPVDIAAINNSVSSTYKLINQSLTSFANLPNPQTRFPLNLDTNNVPGGTPPSLYSGTSATGSFTDFETRFNSGDIFRSASEVCMIRLVPSGQTMSGLSSWWNNNQLTGINMRESPYNQIYSRITTKSNTYTVHYWVQSLQQASFPGRNWAQWNESQDVKNGEYRGNTTIERYLDPNTTGLPDYTTNFTANSTSYTPIDSYYSWRVVLQKQFAPGSN